MKNRIVKILLSLTIVSLSLPTLQISGKETEKNSGVIKEFESILDNSVKNISKNLFKKAYTTANVNIRSYPSEEAEILGVIDFNQQIKIYDYDEKWSIIKLKNANISYAYINKKYIKESPCSYSEFYFPNNNGFKSYMPYTSITDKSSLQYNLQHNYAYTGDFGIRQINGRYCVAVGTAFETNIGTYIDLILDNDEIISCVVSDIKSKKDTLSNNITTADNGCVSEFVVDLNHLYDKSRQTGNISSCQDIWNSPVKMIKIYDKNVFN